MSTALEIPDDAMAQPAERTSAPPHEATSGGVARPPGLRTDTLAESVVALLVLAVVQRMVGFVRGILVCRWLSPEELGEWDMAFGFLTLAAPLAVLGLPGSFGRYVEYFRHRGQLRLLVRRTAIVCGALTVLATLIITAARPLFSTVVFGRPDETQLMLLLGITLAVVIVFNYLTELLTALRMARFAAVVQFFNSLTFAGFSILLLWSWQHEAGALVAAYGIACLLQVVGMLWFLRRQWRGVPREATGPTLPAADSANSLAPSDGFWSRLAPFAAWVWVSNLLYNLFDVADRYMIVHNSTNADPLAVVGLYHSSRIVPLLLVSIASLLGTVILPHLSHDWEAGRRQEVSARMNLTLKLLGLLLFTGSIAILLCAPLLFNVAFNGKFHGGMEVMPWTLTYCSWFGLVTMAQLYLWCAERARLSCLALLIGLVTNVVLNSILLPRFGLIGAVWATVAANGIALAVIFRFSAWLGMKLERSMLLVMLLPLTLGLGLWVALPTLAAVMVGIVGSDWILSRDEKQRLMSVWHSFAHRFASKPAAAASISVIDQAEQPSRRPLRVMFVITAMHVGGAEMLLFNLLRRLDRSRFSPELCCLKMLGELGEKIAADGIPAHSGLLRHKFDIGVLRRLSRLLRERQIDVVVTVGAGDKMFWGRLAAWRAGVPVVISAVHSTGWPDGINWLNRRLTPLTDAFVAVADRHAQHLVDCERLPAGRVCVIPNGVDTKKCSPRQRNLPRPVGIPSAAPLVGIVAVLRPEKNHEMFLRVADRVRRDVPDAHFMVIGDGPRRAELESLTTELGLTECVHFVGQRADVPELLATLDVFVLTSHIEANPVSILEALATGKPVVATNVGSISETVRDGVTGYLVEPGDELAMFRRVAELLLDPAKAQRLGAAGRQLVVERWSVDRMVAGYEELMERIYRKKSAGRHFSKTDVTLVPIADCETTFDSHADGQ